LNRTSVPHSVERREKLAVTPISISSRLQSTRIPRRQWGRHLKCDPKDYGRAQHRSQGWPLSPSPSRHRQSRASPSNTARVLFSRRFGMNL
jgi:hypothetical protein